MNNESKNAVRYLTIPKDLPAERLRIKLNGGVAALSFSGYWADVVRQELPLTEPGHFVVYEELCAKLDDCVELEGIELTESAHAQLLQHWPRNSGHPSQKQWLPALLHDTRHFLRSVIDAPPTKPEGWRGGRADAESGPAD